MTELKDTDIGPPNDEIIERVFELAKEGRATTVDDLYDKTGYICISYNEKTQSMYGVMPMLMTAGLAVGITKYGYERRYCYETTTEAMVALLNWDGVGDPPGKWIKEKPSDRLGPGAST